MKSKFLQIKVEHDIGKMLEKFQAQYWAETGERITKEQVINLALPVYINAVYKLSNEKESDGK